MQTGRQTHCDICESQMYPSPFHLKKLTDMLGLNTYHLTRHLFFISTFNNARHESKLAFSLFEHVVPCLVVILSRVAAWKDTKHDGTGPFEKLCYQHRNGHMTHCISIQSTKHYHHHQRIHRQGGFLVTRKLLQTKLTA